MKILIACDSFKDALGARDVCQAIASGLQNVGPSVEVTLCPLADGGEGTFDCLNFHFNLKKIELPVSGPLFRTKIAYYGIADLLQYSNAETSKEKIAFIEMAQAAGLQLLTPMERNARQTTTLGVGEMLQDAVNRGAQHIVLAIGGSATNDAGLGMATALGYQFFDKNGRKLKPIGENLSKVVNIEPPEKLLDLPTVDVICDVKNPLFGETGAAYVYARQKGATNDDIAYLDEGLRHFASVASSFRPEVSPFREGMGAAGGMGFGAALFLKAYLKNGIDLVLDLIDFDSKLKNVDWVITGEGSLDSQTAHGKLIEGVCRRAAKQNIPVIALCGKVDVPPQLISDLGLRAAFSINSKLTSLPEALAATAENLEKTAYNVGRLFIK